MQHEAQVNSFGSKHATFLAHVSEVVGATTGVVTGGVTTGVVTGGVTTGVVTGGVTTGAAMPVGGKHGDVTHFVRVAPSEGPAVIIELHACCSPPFIASHAATSMCIRVEDCHSRLDMAPKSVMTFGRLRSSVPMKRQTSAARLAAEKTN